MAVQTSVEHDTIARKFAGLYYNCLQSTPESAYAYYLEESVVSRLGDDGTTIKSVTTKEGINDIIIASDYKNCKIVIKNIGSQETKLAGGMIVNVVGMLTTKDNVTRSFTQTFILNKFDGKYFALNDILLFVDAPSPFTPLPVINVGKATTTTAQLNESEAVAPTTSMGKKATDNGKPLTSSDGLGKKATDNGKPLVSSDTKHSLIKKVNVLKPQANEGQSDVVKDSNLATKPQENAPKASFASVLSKTASEAPRPTVVVRVGALHDIQPSASDELNKKTKKAAAAATKSVKNSTNEGKDRIVHISGLPSNTEISSIEKAMQTFGPIFEDTLNFTRKMDGWSYASAKFRSADSARRACEAAVVRIGNRDCGIQYKKVGRDGGNRGRS